MKDTDREPEHDDPGAPPARRPAWVDEQAAAVAPGARRERPGRLPRQPVPGRHEEDGLWEHALEIGGLVTVAAFIAAVAFPHSVEWWEIMMTGAAITAATGFNVLWLAASGPLAAYFTSWGILLTGWLLWARHAGPWHGLVILTLLLPVSVLIPTGVTVIRRHRDRVRRAVQLGRDTAQSRECRHWEDLLPRLRVHGVSVKDVIRAEGGYQVHCRLGKIGDGRQVATRETLRELPQVIAQHKRLPSGAVYIEQEPAGGSSADFIIHVRTVTGPRLARFLPAENRLLSINRKFALGVFGTGREFTLLLREVVVFVCGLRGSGKALDVSTPIATPSGWTTMGEIQPGDYEFDESGKPCRVLAATGVMYGRPCYEIEFSDRTVITADRDHQWFVDTDASRRSQRSKLKRKLGAAQSKSRNQDHVRKRPEILTTEQMIPGLRMLHRSKVTADGGVNNYSVRVAAPLQCPEAEFPVPPYVLGAWLGDGHSASSRITTADPEILAEIEAEGETVWIVPSTVPGAEPYQAGTCMLAGPSCTPSGRVAARRLCVSHYGRERQAGRLDQWPLRLRDTGRRESLAAYTIGGLQVRLRDLGVLGNKHIPVSYLRASEEQRRALLAGLLDTDGTCDEHGAVEFSNSNERLARDAYHLVCSLGYKASIRSKTARLNGKDCGTSWTVQFTPAEKVFRLTRKLARQVTNVRSTASHRYVTAIRRVPSRAVRCIQVDSPSQLYLAGESCVPTHNSTLLSVITAQLARMPDALIFMIDLKGGQEARPWLMPWILGMTDRPVIDWLATTREEAQVMLAALWEAGTARARSGKYGRKLHPGIQKDGEMAPAIIVICDETAVMTGHFLNEGGISNLKLAVQLVRIAETFRSVAIDPVVAAVRAVVATTGDSGLKAMAEVRIGMRVATAHEGQQIFPDNPAAAKQLAQLKDRGMGIPQVGAELHPPVHFFNITDGTPDDDGNPTEDRITPIALAVAGCRPQPEKLVRDAMNATRVTVDGEDMGVYDARWKQPEIRKLLETWRQEAGLPDLPPQPAPPRPGQDPAEDSGEVRDALDVMLSQDPLLRELDLNLGDDDEDLALRLHPAYKRMRELLIERGAPGYQSGMVWHLLLNEGFSVARETVCRWLAKDEKLGYVYRSGKHRSKWIWILRPGAEFDIPGMGG